MPKSAPISGDILDLYNYYRFSDHEATAVSLKDKVLSKKDIYFEGHMDWTFKDCRFEKKIFFGHEGPTMEDDNRGTEENQEPLPPYGSNGLNFTGCEISEPVDIQDNCVVIFKNCRFTAGCPTIKIHDSCRAEFLNCVFDKCDIAISKFCTFKFTLCTHVQCDETYIMASGASKGAVHGGSFSDFAKDHVIHAESGSEIVVTSPRSDLNSNHDCVYATNASSIKLFAANKVQGKPAVSAKNGSKIEVRDVRGLTSGALYGVFSDSGSEVFCSDVGAIHSGSSNAAKISGASKARFDKVELITSPVETALLVEDNSDLSVSNVKEISSVEAKCLDATDSSVSISNVKQAFTVDDDVICLDNSTGYFRSFELMAMVSGEAVVNSKNKSAVYLSKIKVIATSEGDAVRADDALVEDSDGEVRVGDTAGYHSTNDGVVTTRLIGDVSTTTGPGVLIDNAGVDIRTISLLTGKTFGIEGTDARGVIKDNTKITGTESAGISINGTSGVLSIFDNTLVTSSAEEAFVFSGEHDKTQVGNIAETDSPSNAIDISGYTGGTLMFKDMGVISAGDIGVRVNATGGYVGFTDIGKVTSSAEGFKVTTSGQAKITLDNIEDTLGVPNTIFDLTLQDDSQVLVSNTGLLRSSNPIKINTKKDTKVILRDIGAIESEEYAVSGTCEGELVAKRVASITSGTGGTFDVSGNSSSQSRVKLVDVASISQKSASGDSIKLTNFSRIDISNITSFSGSTDGFAFYLTGISQNIGDISFIDVASIATKKGGGVYAANGRKARIQGVSSQSEITLGTAATCVQLSDIGGEISGYAFDSDGGKALDIAGSTTVINGITIPANNGSVSYSASNITHNGVSFANPVTVLSPSILDLYATTFGVVFLSIGCVFKSHNSTIDMLVIGVLNSLVLLNTTVTMPMLVPATSYLIGCGAYTAAPIVEGSAIVVGPAGFDGMSGSGCAINVSNSEVGAFPPQELLRTGIKVYNDAIGIWNNWGQW